MAERRAAGFNIPLNFYDGPEVDSIPKRIRAAAIGVWALAGDYAATQLSDGFVPAGVLKTFGCTDAIRAALKVTINKKGELSPLWIDARNGGIQLTNWTKHQRTNDEVTAYRSSEAERKRIAREALAKAAASQNAETSAECPDGQSAAFRTDARDPKTETETKTETTTANAVVRPRKRGTRLEPNWIPSEEAIAAMKTECPHVNLEAEHRKFVDYWTDKTGKDATKISWDGTWRNWMRRAESQTPQGRPVGVHKLRAVSELAAELRAQEESELVTAEQRRAALE